MKQLVLIIFLVSLLATVIDLIKPFLGRRLFILATVILALSIPCVIFFYF